MILRLSASKSHRGSFAKIASTPMRSPILTVFRHSIASLSADSASSTLYLRATRNLRNVARLFPSGHISFGISFAPSPNRPSKSSTIDFQFSGWGNSWNSFVGSVSLREQGKHIRQSSEKRQTIPARFARGSRAARPTSENTAPRDAMKLNDAFPRRDRTYSLSAPSLVDENQPPTLPNMDDIFLHDAPIARRARARAMAPSRRLSRYVPLSIRSTDRLVDRGRGLRYGVQHPAQVQRQFDDREKPHCSTRERALGAKGVGRRRKRSGARVRSVRERARG